MMPTISMFQVAEKVQKEDQLSILGVVFGGFDRVNRCFGGNSSAARILGTRTHCCAMEAMIIDGKMRRKC